MWEPINRCAVSVMSVKNLFPPLQLVNRGTALREQEPLQARVGEPRLEQGLQSHPFRVNTENVAAASAPRQGRGGWSFPDPPCPAAGAQVVVWSHVEGGRLHPLGSQREGSYVNLSWAGDWDISKEAPRGLPGIACSARAQALLVLLSLPQVTGPTESGRGSFVSLFL